MLSPTRPARDPYWLTLEVCREFVRNKCNRFENDCKFAHPPAHVEVQGGKVICCFDSLLSRCHRLDPPCKYFHPPQHLRDQLTQNRKAQIPTQKTSQIQHLLPLPISSFSFQSPSMLQNAPTSIHSVPYTQTSFGPICATSRHLNLQSPSLFKDNLTITSSNQVPLGWMIPSGVARAQKPLRSDRLEVCREYQRDMCNRNTNECRFAHPPHNIAVDTDNQVTVCMDFAKSRCQREVCRYFHPPVHLISQLRIQQRTQPPQANPLVTNNLMTSGLTNLGSLLSSLTATTSQTPPTPPSYQFLAALLAQQNQQQQPSINCPITTTSDFFNQFH